MEEWRAVDMRLLVVVILGFTLTLGFALADLCPPAIAQMETPQKHSTDHLNRTVVAQAPVKKSKKVVLPQYEVLNEEIYDAPVKAQIVQSLLVSGEITEDGLRALLQKQYDSLKTRRGFTYYKFPTNIFIHAYTTKERYEGGMGQWIAMLAKTYSDTDPTISIKDRQLSQLGAKPVSRFGLSESKRKEVWRGIVLAEDRATKKAEQRYPIKPGDGMPQIERQIDLQRSLQKQYKEVLAKRHGLTRQQLDEIMIEGVKKDWPIPKK